MKKHDQSGQPGGNLGWKGAGKPDDETTRKLSDRWTSLVTPLRL